MASDNLTATSSLSAGDLNTYFERIGYGGPTPLTVDTLHAIVRAHVQSIPFENIDVLLDRGVKLDVPSVWNKLVRSPRGGYCFEHNTLIEAVLRSLGFETQLISARVRLGRPRDFVPARTHMFVRVNLASAAWLVDAGVGGLSPTAALSLDTEAPQSTPHEPRRIVRVGHWSGAERSPEAKLIHQVLLNGEWQDICEFTLEAMPPIDRTLANWYLNTHPESHFRDRLMLAKAHADGRSTLVNREFTRRDTTGESTTTAVTSAAQLTELLHQQFGITGVDSEAVWAKLP